MRRHGATVAGARSRSSPSAPSIPRATPRCRSRRTCSATSCAAQRARRRGSPAATISARPGDARLGILERAARQGRRATACRAVQKTAAKKPPPSASDQGARRGENDAANRVRGMIAVDKIGCKILFINPQTYETETVSTASSAPCMNCWSCRKPAAPMCRSSATASTAAIRTPAIRCTSSISQAQALSPTSICRLTSRRTRAARRRRADLHHLREQRQGRRDRPEDQQSDRRDRFRLDQRPPPLHHAMTAGASIPTTRRTRPSR